MYIGSKRETQINKRLELEPINKFEIILEEMPPMKKRKVEPKAIDTFLADPKNNRFLEHKFPRKSAAKQITKHQIDANTEKVANAPKEVTVRHPLGELSMNAA